MTKYALEPRTAALRLSLLASLGLLPFACSTTPNNADGDNSSGGNIPEAGAAAAAGAGSDAGGTGGGAGGDLGIGAPPVCSSPMLDPISGLTTCAEGYRYRKTAVACATRGGASDGQAGAGGESGAGGAASQVSPASPVCTTECTEPHSFCQEISPTPYTTACVVGCQTDDDCSDYQLCLCDTARGGGGVCMSATCRSDQDCEAGYHCAQAESCLYNHGAFTCQKAEDECLTGHDCGGAMCWYDDSSNHRACANGPCGRPFLVAAEARVAAVVPGPAWASSETARPRIEHLSVAERAKLAAHWTRMGQMEHASIAAFARFSLQLLSLGAPPELVEACTGALADETAHTKLCFELAGAYAGRAISPGPLDVAGSLEVTALVDIVDLVIAEGCFGETGAALEAADSADSATEPVIRAAYARIAVDEQRHAELAFRFVRWALQRDYAAVSARVRAALANSATPCRALGSVVAPCLEALLLASEAA